MLHELDTALRALVEREIATDGEVEIDFDAPTKDWAAHRNQPTIDIYLYDIRQDVHPLPVRRGRASATTTASSPQRRPQPKFFRLAYLVTAWTQRAEDEHRLLSALMVTFLRHDIVPPDLLDGSLADLGISIPMAVALPPPQDRALSDVWSALGGELKPSLDVSLIAPLLPERFAEVGPPVHARAGAQGGRPRAPAPARRTAAGRCPTTARPACSTTAARRRAPAEPTRARRRTRGVTAVAGERRRRSPTCSAGSTCCACASRPSSPPGGRSTRRPTTRSSGST